MLVVWQLIKLHTENLFPGATPRGGLNLGDHRAGGLVLWKQRQPIVAFLGAAPRGGRTLGGP